MGVCVCSTMSQVIEVGSQIHATFTRGGAVVCSTMSLLRSGHRFTPRSRGEGRLFVVQCLY